MPLAPGTRLGPYEIIAPLGVGGMGEVYRARDTRLSRDIAIKALPSALATNPERVARFEREARLLASLNHPNIAMIHGVERHDGALCLALELIEGESLAERLTRGPLSMEEAFDVAAQVATALEAAHDAGVIHRDLKPGNVMVRTDGLVKVLDFGLARGPAVEAESVDVSQSPTMTSPATLPGVILGTAAYMSPEQAKGRTVDRRADLWAWGCLLFELLTGTRAFAGDDVSETLASILKSEPDWSILPSETPPRVRELLERCLKKDVRERLRDAGDARLLLAEGRRSRPVSIPTAPPSRSWLLVGAAFGLGALVAMGVPLVFHHDAALRTYPVRLPFLPPDSVTIDERASDYAVISPDGRFLLFAGRTPHSGRLLWLRALDSLGVHSIPGTDNATEPLWSPDGRSIAFSAEGKLRRVDLAGGQPKVLADAPRLTGAAWSPHGVIVFSPNFRSALERVPDDGGPVTRVCSPDTAKGETGYRAGGFLPDGSHFLYRVEHPESTSWWVRALDGSDAREVVKDADLALFAPPHWLLFVRRGTLFAQHFDPSTRIASGDAVPVPSGVAPDQSFENSRMSASSNGILVVQVHPPYAYRLIWCDRTGHRLGIAGSEQVTRVSERPSLSPDGRRIVLQRPDPQTGIGDIWTLDVARGTLDRVTSDPGLDQLPVWSADGTSIFDSARHPVPGMYRVSAEGGDGELLIRGTVWPTCAMRDGRHLLFSMRGATTRADIWIMALDGHAKPHPLVDGSSDEYQAQASPDGHWLAYACNETDRYEVYVRRFDPEGGVGPAVRVSTAGGFAPRWRGDGRELFYVEAPLSAADGKLMSVRIETRDGTFVPGAPTALFDVHMFPDGFSQEYDVTPDGQRFLVGEATRDPHVTGVNLLFGWAGALPR